MISSHRKNNRNGAPNKIQASESTALLLRQAGKEHWVSAREERITAKGKGTVQTYWIDVAAGSASGKTSTHTPSVTDSDSDNSDFMLGTYGRYRFRAAAIMGEIGLGVNWEAAVAVWPWL